MRPLHLVLRAIRFASLLIALASLLVLAVGPHVLGYRTLTVLSGSMSPTIPAGSVVVSVPKPAGELAVGDILTFKTPEASPRVVTHRVAEIVEPGLAPVVRTQADADVDLDPWPVRIEGTAWVTQAHVPHVGYVIHELRRPVARNALIYGLPALILLLSLRRIWRPRTEDGAEEIAETVPVPGPVGAMVPPDTVRPLLNRGRKQGALVMAMWGLAVVLGARRLARGRRVVRAPGWTGVG